MTDGDGKGDNKIEWQVDNQRTSDEWKLTVGSRLDGLFGGVWVRLLTQNICYLVWSNAAPTGDVTVVCLFSNSIEEQRKLCTLELKVLSNRMLALQILQDDVRFHNRFRLLLRWRLDDSPGLVVVGRFSVRDCGTTVAKMSRGSQ